MRRWVLGVTLATHALAQTHPDAAAGRSIVESQCALCHIVQTNSETPVRVNTTEKTTLPEFSIRCGRQWLFPKSPAMAPESDRW